MSDLVRPGAESPFDAIRREDERGEYWSARELMPLLGYERWESFADAIDRARVAARNSGSDPDQAFSGRREDRTGGRPRADYRLSRYGAYLTALNGDPRKTEIAQAQTYFAVKTREAEVAAPTATPDLTTAAGILAMAEQYAATARRLVAVEARAAEAETYAAELEPAAHAWADLADASGDFDLRAAAQVLSRSPGIDTGQKRLARELRALGWIGADGRPYQTQIRNGRMVARMRSWTDPDTGEERVSWQPRITPKGMEFLHRHLGGTATGQLELEGSPR